MSKSPMRHIGIIEDDALVREGLKDCMESAGFSVESYGSAEDFLAAQSSERFACLIVDIDLPGISGLELQNKLSAGKEPVPVVFVTAHGTEANREQALRNGASALLSKPARREELLNAVRTAIER